MLAKRHNKHILVIKNFKNEIKEKKLHALKGQYVDIGTFNQRLVP